MTKKMRGFNGCWFMFFTKAMFDLGKEYIDVPVDSYQAMDNDINAHETFFYMGARYVKYNGWVRYLYDIARSNYFLVGAHVMRDPRVHI